MKFLLRQQKYLELLEAGQSKEALECLRKELSPLNINSPKVHFLSSLLMCTDPSNLRTLAKWDGAAGDSRKELLKEIQGT